MREYELISTLFLFNDTDFDVINEDLSITDNAVKTSYSDRETILSAKDDAIGIGLIVNGKASISSSERTNSPFLRMLNEGDTFGAASLFKKNGGYFTSVMAIGDCTVVYITKDTVRKLFEKYPLTAINYIEFLSDRIAFLNKKVSTFTAQNAEARIACYIYQLTNGEAKKATLPFSYSMLSDHLGIGRASLYRALDLMCQNEIISRDSKSITVLSPDGLLKMLK